MPISQTECYFKNPWYRFLEEPIYAVSISFKMKPLKKAFSFVKTKANWNCPVNLAEMLKEATIHFCQFDDSHFSNSRTL